MGFELLDFIRYLLLLGVNKMVIYYLLAQDFEKERLVLYQALPRFHIIN